jgi:hypothetical protein
VRLVEHERLGAAQREPLAVLEDDLVVEDDDLRSPGLPARDAAPGEHRNGPVREPRPDLSFPVELEGRGAHDDGRVGVVGLERRERLDGLAETLLVGEEGAAALEQVGDAGALERLELAAEPCRHLRRQLGAGAGAGATDRLDRLVVLHPDRVERSAGIRRDIDLVLGEEVLEPLDEERVDGQRRPVPLRARQQAERGERLGIPVDVESEAWLGDPGDEREGGGGGGEADLQAGGAAGGAAVEAGARELEQGVGHLWLERKPLAPATVRRAVGKEVGKLVGDRVGHEPAPPVVAGGGDAADPARGALGQPGVDLRRDAQLPEALDDALDVRAARIVGLGPPLPGIPVEAPAGDAAHRVDDLRAVGEREDDHLPAVRRGAQGHVVRRGGELERHASDGRGAAGGSRPDAPARRGGRLERLSQRRVGGLGRMGHGGRPPARPQAVTQRRIAREAPDRGGQGRGLVGRDEQRVGAVAQVLGRATRARRDDRAPDRHRLERHEPPGFCPADGEEDRVGSRVEVAHRRSRDDRAQAQAVGEPETGRQVAQLRHVGRRAVADQVERRAGELGERPDRVSTPLRGESRPG